MVSRNVCLKLETALSAFIAVALTVCELQGRKLEQQALTPQKWMSKYWCSLAPANSSLVQSNAERRLYVEKRAWPQSLWYKIMHDCNRDQTLWRANYVDELAGSYGVLVKDSSADERLANMRSFLALQAPLDFNYFQFNSGDPKRDHENLLRVAGPSVNDSQCELDLNEMVQQLDELGQLLRQMRAQLDNGARMESRHFKLMRALDAFGRYESGALSGHSRSLGFYEQCVKSVVERSKKVVGRPMDMRMRFCWARTSLRKRLNPNIKQRHKEPDETSDDALPVAVCLPKSCHSRNLNSAQNKRLVKKLLDSQLTFPASIYLDQHPELESIFCLPDEEGDFKMPTSGKLCLLIAALWVFICCLVTYLNVDGQQTNEDDRGQVGFGLEKTKERTMKVVFSNLETWDQFRRPSWIKIAKCLDLRSAWIEFSSDRIRLAASDSVDLDMLNIVKVLTCIYCVYSHAAFFRTASGDHLLETFSRLEADRSYQLMSSSSSMLDIFFVISGLLTCYIACKRLRLLEQERGARSSATISIYGSTSPLARKSSWLLSLRGTASFFGFWLAISANRYFRLVPLYALFFYFRRDVFTYLGSGPLWDFGFNKDTMTGACLQASPLSPFNLDSLWTPLNKQCILVAWTISADILFCALLPPFLVLLQRRPRLALGSMAAMVLACALYGVKIYADQPNADLFELGELRFHGEIMVVGRLSSIYTSPVIRCGPFFVGVMSGYILFKYAQSQEAINQATNSTAFTAWPAWFSGAATKLALAYFAHHLLVGCFQMDLKQMIAPYHRLYAAYNMTLNRTVWSIALSVVLLRLTTDWRHRPWLGPLANQKLRSLARLNYALLFVHWILVLMAMGTDIKLPVFRLWDMYAAYSSVYMLSLPLALLVHLIFECPLNKLINKQIFKY